ncbi:hypothetical protein OSTOST_18076 [Ostertagia ostertagi]
MEMEPEQVVNVLHPEPFYDKSRRANGTAIDDEETVGAAKVFRRAQAMMPFINFESSELWQDLTGTVFPRLKTTVTPTPGDVIFWINVNVDETEARGSLHGGCPVYRGEKVAAVKWILVDEQDIFQSPHEDGTFAIEKLIYPHTYYYDTTPMYGKCVAKKKQA